MRTPATVAPGTQRLGPRRVDHGAVGQRIGERDAELDEVGAAVDVGLADPQRLLDRREAAHQVGHEGRAALGVGEGVGDALGAVHGERASLRPDRVLCSLAVAAHDDDDTRSRHGGTRGRSADAGRTAPPPRALVWFGSTAVLILVVYLLVPHLAGIEDTWNRIRDGSPAWLAAAVALEAVSYAGYAWNVAAVSAADRVVLGFRRSAQITLAATAATRLLAAGGAGGIAVTTWALSRAGHGPRGAAKQVSSHLVATYAVFVGAIVLFGTGLAIAGAEPLLSAVPAVLGALVFAAYGDRDPGAGRAAAPAGQRRRPVAPGAARRAPGAGRRHALHHRVGPPPRARACSARCVWWVFDVATLWACFWAFGGHPNVAELTMAYLLGMLGNLLPLPGGVGGVEGGMVGACAAFGMDAGIALVAVLAYRAISVWLPALPGVLALATLRRAADGAEVAPG